MEDLALGFSGSDLWCLAEAAFSLLFFLWGGEFPRLRLPVWLSVLGFISELGSSGRHFSCLRMMDLRPFAFAFACFACLQGWGLWGEMRCLYFGFCFYFFVQFFSYPPHSLPTLSGIGIGLFRRLVARDSIDTIDTREIQRACKCKCKIHFHFHFHFHSNPHRNMAYLEQWHDHISKVPAESTTLS